MSDELDDEDIEITDKDIQSVAARLPADTAARLQAMKDSLTSKKERPSNEPKWDMGLSTGSTTLNMACSGRPDVGFAPDYFYVWSGRSGSGKTYITLAGLAEASINPKYKDHELVFDCPENGALMNIKKHYGWELARRIKPPAGTREAPQYSRTLESMYHNVHNAIANGPCIYLLDSMDPLPTDNELRDFLKKNKKRTKYLEEGGIPSDEAGDYGTERAKVNAKHLRILFNELRDTGSIVIVIFQARQNIGMFSQHNPDTRGGGTAPTFYAGLELWSKVHSHLKVKEKVSGKSVEQGVICEVRVKKGRIQGKDRTVNVPIYHSGDYPGIDDVGGCVDYMTEWKRWPKAGKEYDPTDGKIDASDFKVALSREKLIQHILDNNLEDDLRDLVADTWNSIEEACAVRRKPRYGQ